MHNEVRKSPRQRNSLAAHDNAHQSKPTLEHDATTTTTPRCRTGKPHGAASARHKIIQCDAESRVLEQVPYHMLGHRTQNSCQARLYGPLIDELLNTA